MKMPPGGSIVQANKSSEKLMEADKTDRYTLNKKLGQH